MLTAATAKAGGAPTPALSERQRLLLSLLGALGGKVARLDFQKLLFLFCNEGHSEAPYEFVPYKFGAFSFTSYADRRKLVERNYLADGEDDWCLTDTGRAALGHVTDLQLSAFVWRHRAMRGDALVAETYRRFPYHATRSEIADRVLRGDDAALSRIDKARMPASTTSLGTIGYEGRSVEGYLNELVRGGFTVLCDVRRNPLGRKYGFAKSTLSTACQVVGIRYEHLPELGIASDKRRHLESQADYDELFAEYERDSLPVEADALVRIQTWICAGERVALTCYEKLPGQCHRHCVAEALERRFGKGFRARHL